MTDSFIQSITMLLVKQPWLHWAWISDFAIHSAWRREQGWVNTEHLALAFGLFARDCGGLVFLTRCFHCFQFDVFVEVPWCHKRPVLKIHGLLRQWFLNLPSLICGSSQNFTSTTLLWIAKQHTCTRLHNCVTRHLRFVPRLAVLSECQQG